ncbi:TlpA family protein disulfide reductase [Candidatus Poribacteria bacterium]|nr:TlpA family protein disulfide reductase [Candidatus Poribacteria bacterium]
MSQRFSPFPQNLVSKHVIIFRLIGVILISIFFIQCSQNASNPPKIGDRAPNFSLKSLTGERVTLKDLTRKGTVLVNFWATWCAPCKAEVPLLNQIRDDGLTVVGISVEERKDMVASFCKRNSVKYSVLLDPDGKVAKQYGLISVPTTFLVNQGGVVLFQHSQMIDKQMVTDALEETKPGSKTGE